MIWTLKTLFSLKLSYIQAEDFKKNGRLFPGIFALLTPLYYLKICILKKNREIQFLVGAPHSLKQWMFWTLHIFTHLKLPVGTRWNSQTRPFSKRFQMHSLVFRFHHTGVRQFFTTKKYHWTDKSKIVQKDHKVYSFVFFDIVFFFVWTWKCMIHPLTRLVFLSKGDSLSQFGPCEPENDGFQVRFISFSRGLIFSGSKCQFFGGWWKFKNVHSLFV